MASSAETGMLGRPRLDQAFRLALTPGFLPGYPFPMASVDPLIASLWQGYTAINPQAEAIHRLLNGRGDSVRNDHIALRTYADPRVGLSVLAHAFVQAGYTHGGDYRFTGKRLRAHHYDPPRPDLPRVFISELLIDELSKGARTTIYQLLDQIPTARPASPDFCASGRPWAPVSRATYEELRSESEYAAWMAAFGYRANHFTVSVNALDSIDHLAEFCDILEAAGFELNRSGGHPIKGSSQQGLSQASTLAAPVEVTFADGTLTIPGCYYEFAQRHPDASGKLFGGFITGSADKLFESTHRR